MDADLRQAYRVPGLSIRAMKVVPCIPLPKCGTPPWAENIPGQRGGNQRV